MIKSRAAEIGYGLETAVILEEEQPEIMIELAISLINLEKADIIMKGLIPTAKIIESSAPEGEWLKNRPHYQLRSAIGDKKFRPPTYFN